MSSLDPHTANLTNTVFDDENDPFIVYERQISYVKTLLNRNPEFLEVLDKTEQALFQEYFLPDWEVESHFVRYYRKLMKQKPELARQANDLLKKFLSLNHLSPQDGLAIS
jgi:hypothetical protein